MWAIQIDRQWVMGEGDSFSLTPDYRQARWFAEKDEAFTWGHTYLYGCRWHVIWTGV